MIDNVLVTASARLRAWLSETVLPLWAETARLDDGSWVEHLNPDGTPDLRAERRWRVMARQAVAYAQADMAGWYDGREVAIRTFQTFWEQGWKDGAVVHRILPDGTISNRAADLYDHAFALLACARLYQLTSDREYLLKAEDVLTWIRSRQHPAGGFEEGTLKPLPRRQNPHMHLLEASLALFEATGQADHLEIANEVVSLFETGFFDGSYVREFFTDDWSLDADRGDVVEPGHAMEWVWLLSEYDKAVGADHAAQRDALYTKAQAGRPHFLYDEETASGEIVRQTGRLWVQTEVIKAHLAMTERGYPGSREMAASVIEALFGTYLLETGLWVDQLNACGANIAETVPTSTLYHIVLMAVEADRVAAL